MPKYSVFFQGSAEIEADTDVKATEQIQNRLREAGFEEAMIEDIEELTE